MLVVGNTVVSDELINECFCCDLAKCKGACCVEGDYGAPITKEEKTIIKKILPLTMPLLPTKAKETIAKYNFFTLDDEGQLCTQIIDGKDCVFCIKDEQQNTLCAFQKLYLQGKIDFIKPISCHLYPIRISEFEQCSALNYNRWNICCQAVLLGKRKNIPVYKYCREPLIRRFGLKWYNELEQAIENNKTFFNLQN